jgi:hypothetical protein
MNNRNSSIFAFQRIPVSIIMKKIQEQKEKEQKEKNSKENS